LRGRGAPAGTLLDGPQRAGAAGSVLMQIMGPAALGLLLLAGPAAAQSVPRAEPAAPTPPAAPVEPGSPGADLMKLSLDELMKIDVSTVSRKAERLWSAPSGVDVVTDEDIR